MMKPPRIAILASGEGTTAEAVIVAGINSRVNLEVGLVICSNPKAGIFQRIEHLNNRYNLAIPCVHISHRNFPANNEQLRAGDQTVAEEAAILDRLMQGTFDLICLMGYMKRIGPRLVHEFGARPDHTSPYQAMMVNTHPGLLPATKGLYGVYVQQYVLNNKLPFAGQTLHIVAEAYDEGPVIAEHKVRVTPADNPDDLFDRVKKVEKKYLPLDLDDFIQKRKHYFTARETSVWA